MNFELERINEIARGDIAGYILEYEQMFDGRIQKIAEHLACEKRHHWVVTLAGPSSSGKTTFSKKLALAATDLCMRAQLISLDNFYLPLSEIPMNEEGKQDFESVYALDLPEIARFFKSLFQNGTAVMPVFNFQTRRREEEGEEISFGDETVIFVEGIHGLNDEIIRHIPSDSLYKIYLSVKRGFNYDQKELFSKRDVRLFRRLVRDFHHRSSPAQNTFYMWPDVIQGDVRYIKPFQSNADIQIDTMFPYDLGVLKSELTAILEDVVCDREYGEMAVNILRGFEKVRGIDEALVPARSLLQEFIGDGI